jgi:hypothetical protein
MQNHSSETGGLNPLLTTLIIIHFSLGMGVLIFSGVIVFLSFEAKPIPDPELSFHEMMAYIAVIFGFSATVFSFYLFPNMINKNKSAYTDIHGSRYPIFQSAHILRMALLEGMALFGLVSLLLYVMNVGPLNYNIEVLLSALPVLMFVALWIYLFPSEQKVRDAVGN